ncbi:immunoglobulin lambda-1 light chain-like [Hemicordylus capensis]|uniref:immunoglobulin lambda-1 light chain-like n=1 Tax=Hemicordylus capensis TaxID=884348 RepID=UPI002304B672|nr:immunoglobulin lambda-1 light chain-like [Hemicordylus capensis]
MDLLAPALWFLGVLLAAGSAEATLTQLSSIRTSLGEVAWLPCTLSSESITAYTILWFQHRPPRPPKYLLYYKDGSSRGQASGVSDRFSASKNATSSTCYLTISGVWAEDDGDYYCLTSKGGEYTVLQFAETPVPSERYPTMTWPLFSLAVLYSCLGVSSQITLTQPASESVHPGQLAQLSCTNNGGVGDLGWYQQRQGQGPRFVAWKTDRGAGIPDRFTASASGDRGTGYLTITNAQAEDEADYYCAIWNILKNFFWSASEGECE